MELVPVEFPSVPTPTHACFLFRDVGVAPAVPVAAEVVDELEEQAAGDVEGGVDGGGLAVAVEVGGGGAAGVVGVVSGVVVCDVGDGEGAVGF